jgi:hypothetical protein
MFKKLKENQTKTNKEPPNEKINDDNLTLDIYKQFRKGNSVKIFITSAVLYNLTNCFTNPMVMHEIQTNLLMKGDLSYRFNYITAEGKLIGFIYAARQFIIKNFTDGDYYRYTNLYSFYTNFFTEFLNGLFLGAFLSKYITSVGIYQYYTYDLDYNSSVPFNKFIKTHSINGKVYYAGAAYHGIFRGLQWGLYFTFAKFFDLRESALFNKILFAYIATESAYLIRIPFNFLYKL